ncbi:MAG TPA: cohesin domain-containing protein [bacterium]|nr:cohesin domain-containing protein [bacterium]HPN45979.1 cohesin domain-containing protein [bacterium]
MTLTTYRLYYTNILLTLFFILITNAKATITVSLPAAIGYPGSTVLVPIHVTDVTGEEIYSAGTKITFDAALLEATAIVIDGCLLQEWGAPTSNIGDGSVLLGAAGSAPLSGSGVLFFIRFMVTGSSGLVTPLTFESLEFNEGTPAAETHNGEFRVVDVTYGSVLAVAPDSIDYSVTYGEVNPATSLIHIDNAGTGTLDWTAVESAEWLTLSRYSGQGPDSITVIFDITELAVGVYSDSIVVTAAGAESSPQTVYITLNIEPKASIIISIPDSNVVPMAHFTLPVLINDMTGWGFTSARFTLVFNPLILECSGVYTKGALTEIWGAPNVTISPGQVHADISGSAPLTGSGVLFWIDFRVLGACGSSCDIEIDEFLFDNVIHADSTRSSHIYIKIPDNIPKEQAPAHFYLWQNYPNPFNPVTQIKYHVAAPSFVKINIYDIGGKLVRNLIHKYHSAGVYEITWNGVDNFTGKVASGIYYCRFECDNFCQSRVMTIVK